MLLMLHQVVAKQASSMMNLGASHISLEGLDATLDHFECLFHDLGRGFEAKDYFKLSTCQRCTSRRFTLNNSDVRVVSPRSHSYQIYKERGYGITQYQHLIRETTIPIVVGNFEPVEVLEPEVEDEQEYICEPKGEKDEFVCDLDG